MTNRYVYAIEAAKPEEVAEWVEGTLRDVPGFIEDYEIKVLGEFDNRYDVMMIVEETGLEVTEEDP